MAYCWPGSGDETRGGRRAELHSTDGVAAADRHLAALYTLTTELMIKVSNDRLAWTAADRALQAAAVDGDRDTATALIAEAAGAAARVAAGPGATAFNPTAVGLYQVSIARVLGDSGTAVEHARRIDPAAIPVVERRARHYSDVARAFHRWGKPEQCYRALLAAEHASPGEVRYRPAIHRITESLVPV